MFSTPNLFSLLLPSHARWLCLQELSEAEKADRLACLELNVQKLLSQLMHDDTLQGRCEQTACREATSCSASAVQQPSGTMLWSIKYRPAATADVRSLIPMWAALALVLPLFVA